VLAGGQYVEEHSIATALPGHDFANASLQNHFHRYAPMRAVPLMYPFGAGDHANQNDSFGALIIQNTINLNGNNVLR